MGYAIAAEAARRGAKVTLISGPTALQPPAGVETHYVETAEGMRAAVVDRAAEEDVVVMAAAVADFRPAQVVAGKIKRKEGAHLDLVPTGDIAAEAVRVAPRAIHVAFALEAENLVAAAQEKRERKGVDLVVGNAISDEHSPFGAETNRVVLVARDGVIELPLLSKAEAAARIWDRVVELLAAKLD
jgi:phosphopantothenoylcysteine decarboxylase/phosphopantothenate--cysteine ligase